MLSSLRRLFRRPVPPLPEPAPLPSRRTEWLAWAAEVVTDGLAPGEKPLCIQVTAEDRHGSVVAYAMARGDLWPGKWLVAVGDGLPGLPEPVVVPGTLRELLELEEDGE